MTTTLDKPAPGLAQTHSQSNRTLRYVRPGTPLTERETQILDLASRGCSNATAGARLYLSEDTVKTYMRKIFVRLGAHDRAHAVRRGFELGLLTADTEAAQR